MMEWVLKLLGADTSSVARIAEASIALRGGLGAGWWFVLTAAAAVGTWWLYRKNPVQLPARCEYVLMTLRFCFVGLLLLLLMRPILSLTVEGNIRRLLVLLVDGSASMQIQDPRIDLDDQKRLAIARDELDPAQRLQQTFNPNNAPAAFITSRLEVVRRVLKNERLDLLPRLDREFDLSAFSFGDSLREWSVRNVASA